MEMLNDDEVLHVLVAHLDGMGIVSEVQRPGRDDYSSDTTLTLERGGSRQLYLFELKQALRPSDIRSLDHLTQSSTPAVLGLGSVVSSRSADALRANGLQYIDVVGNAHIQFGDVLVDVRGRRPASTRKPAASSSGNLFSAARAQVVFALLQWPRLWHDSQRAVADAAGVSLGQAHSALTMLDVVGFGPGGHRRDSHLLDLWATAFATGLGEKLVLGRYRGSATDLTKVRADDTLFSSGEPMASELVHPHSLVVYVDGFDPMLPIVNRWRADGEPNITVRRTFWTTPPGETRDDDGPLAGLRPAPAVLVYADLISNGDPRVREVAEEWRSRVAGPDLPA